MTTTVYFIRHAAHSHLGRVLSGRMAGIGLTDEGRLAAARAGRHLVGRSATAVYTSPLQRARETASIVAEPLGLPEQPAEELNEIDFGGWTGRDFASLEGDVAWDRWNRDRSLHRPPGGESMVEVQLRLAIWLSRVHGRHPDSAVIAVSHADVIKAALAHALGLSMDHHHRLEVSPASISILVYGEWGQAVHGVNAIPL